MPPFSESSEIPKESGLFTKYVVSKANGEPVDPKADYFVLRLDTDESARSAARLYAEDIKDRLPALAEELIDKLDWYDYGNGGDRHAS